VVKIANFEFIDLNSFMATIFNINEDEDIEDDDSLLAKIGVDSSSSLILNISQYIFVFMIIVLLICALLVLRAVRNSHPM